MNENGVTDLIAGIVLQAVADYRENYQRQDRPDAAAFLTSAGLLSASGELDPRFGTTPKTRSGRPSNYGLGQPKQAA